MESYWLVKFVFQDRYSEKSEKVVVATTKPKGQIIHVLCSKMKAIEEGADSLHPRENDTRNAARRLIA